MMIAIIFKYIKIKSTIVKEIYYFLLKNIRITLTTVKNTFVDDICKHKNTLNH